MSKKLNPIRRRVDKNQPEIVKELRCRGCSVQQIHFIGRGCPDLRCRHQRTELSNRACRVAIAVS